MPIDSRSRSRLWLTVVVALFAALHVGWEFLGGGIRSHHLLDRADLPAISNAWGLLSLPVLAWLLIGRMQARSIAPLSFGLDRSILLAMAGALVYGVVLSLGFTAGHASVTSALFMGLFVLAVVLPLYRAEYLLGFVLGMTVTFGAVLPMLVGSVFMLLSVLLHPLARYLVRAVGRKRAA